MSLVDELYTKREFLADIATCDELVCTARENLCIGAGCDHAHCTKGFRLLEIERTAERARKIYKARWAENARWFGALAKAKRDWQRRMFGEHDSEVLKRLNFLRFIVGRLLEGVAKPVERRIEMPSGLGPWARERASLAANRGFMPDCDYEICSGGRWTPVQKQDLPDKVRWV